MNHRFPLLALIALLLGLTAPARAGVRRLTFDPVEHAEPQFNRLGQVVWEQGLYSGGSAFQIGFWDGDTVRILSDSPLGGYHPQINDAGQVVWLQGDQVVLWDGSASRPISQQPVNDALLQINNQGQVVWRDSAEAGAQINWWDGAAVHPLTDDPQFKRPPQINNAGQVAWLQSDGQNPGRVYLWSAGGLRSFPLASRFVNGPELNDRGQVLWWGIVEGISPGIALWDGSAFGLVPSGTTVDMPRLSNSGSVAWSWLANVYLWNGMEVRTFSDPYIALTGLQINGSDQLIWNSFGQIRYWNGTFLQTLTAPQRGANAQINDAGQVVWVGWDGAHTQIYLYTPPGPGSLDLLSPDPVTGGDTATGVVTLPAPAPAGGTVVTLASERPEIAALPPRVQVAAGEWTATFPITTRTVAATTPVTLAASVNGAVWKTTLHVWHPALTGLTLSAASLGGGVPFQGTVTLDGAAPAGGAVVALFSSSPAAASVPATVVVPAGEGSVTFSGQTHGVASTTRVTITAAFESQSRVAALQVRGGQPALVQLYLSPDHVLGGQPATGNLVLDGVAPAGGTVVLLASSSRAAAVPPRLVVPAGQRAISFPIRTFAVRDDTTAQIAAAANGQVQAAPLAIAPLPLAGLTLMPAAVSSGRSVTGTVSLARPAPAGGTVVQLAITGGHGAPVFSLYPQVTVPEGATSATFTIDTLPVTAVTALTVTVSTGGQQLSAALTLLPVSLTALAVAPARVIGPQPALGQVALSGPAPAGGVIVALAADAPAARLPASVRVPAGATAASFPILTRRVRVAAPVTVAASLGGVTRTAALTVLPRQALSLVLRPAAVTGGVAATGTLFLRDPAPAGGAAVTLSASDPARIAFPPSVTIPPGATDVSFDIHTRGVSAPTPVVIRAAVGAAVAGADLALLPPAVLPAAGRVRVLDLPTTDLAYDTATGRLLAGISAVGAPATAPLSDSVISLDPYTGAAGPAVPVGDDPGRLALSDDGRVLYVAIEGGAAVRRVDLAAETAGLRFTLGSDPLTGTLFVEDMAVLPGQDDAVAIARRNRNSMPRHEGVAIYDNGVPRPEITPSGIQESNAIQFSGDPERLYGASTEGDATFQRLDVEASGAAVIDSTPGLLAGIGGDIRFGDGRIVTTTGRLIDPEALVLVGHFPGIPDGQPGRAVPPALVAVDVAAGRVFFLVGSGPNRTLQAFEMETLAPVGSLPVTGVRGSATSLIRWGQDGLAFRTDAGQLFLIRTPLAGPPALALAFAPASVPGGAAATGTVTLAAPAPPGGAVVTLASDDAAVAALPDHVTIPAGAVSATFPIATTPVAIGEAVPIHAAAGAARAVARLQVLAPVLAALAVTPNPLVAHGTGLLQVTLSGPAPAGGATVTLIAPTSTVSASVPARITVPAGAAQASVPITDTGSGGGCGSDAQIQATYGVTRQLLLHLPGEVTGPVLDAPSVEGGGSLQGQFRSECRRDVDLTILLSTDRPDLVAIPPAVTLPAAQLSVRFPIKTHPAATATAVTIHAVLPGLQRQVTLQVGPLAVSDVSLAAATLTAGAMTTGTVTLNGPAPAGGLPVILSTDAPAAVDLPAQVVVPAGATQATFAVRTQSGAPTTTAAIRAAAGGQVRSATLQIRAVGLSLSRASVFAGQSVLATLILPSPVTTGAAQATFSSSDPSVTGLGMVYVPYGAGQISAVISTGKTDTPKQVVISATYGGTTWTATLGVLPPVLRSVTLPGQPVVSGGALAGQVVVISGGTLQGRVTLSYPAPADGAVVHLSSELNDLVLVPDSVTVAAGATTADFPITIRHYASVVTVHVRAEAGFIMTVPLLLLPDRLSFLPNPVEAGQTATGILVLPAPAPAGGAVVRLSDSSAGALNYQPTLSVPAGQQLALFPIRPTAAGPAFSATVTAAAEGQQWSTLLMRSP